MPLNLRAVLATAIIILFCHIGQSFAANHYIRDGATGSSPCSDWDSANACDALPVTLVRGDVYYIADGTYASYTFDDAVSDTTLITIKKSTVADHGTNTGWLDTYGDGQAIFGGWEIYTDYWVFDGQRRNSDWRAGGINQYGIRIKVNGGKAIRLDNGSGTGGDNLTFQYVDVEGGGRDTGDSNSDVIYGLTGNSNITFQFCALHDSDRTIFLMRGNWENLIIDHCYIARNASSPGNHGEMMSMTSATNLRFSNNTVEDTEGTAGLIAGLNGGIWSGGQVYGNTLRYSPAYLACTGRPVGACEGMAAAIFVGNDASNDNTGNNILVYNNTFVNLTGVWSGIHIEAGFGNIVRNNIWYNCDRTGGTGTTNGQNWYFNTVNDTPGTGDQTCSSNCNIFTNLTGGDFHLTTATNAGLNVGTAYYVDPDGVIRGSDGTWDRGAFELFLGPNPQPPPSYVGSFAATARPAAGYRPAASGRAVR